MFPADQALIQDFGAGGSRPHKSEVKPWGSGWWGGRAHSNLSLKPPPWASFMQNVFADFRLRSWKQRAPLFSKSVVVIFDNEVVFIDLLHALDTRKTEKMEPRAASTLISALVWKQINLVVGCGPFHLLFPLLYSTNSWSWQTTQDIELNIHLARANYGSLPEEPVGSRNVKNLINLRLNLRIKKRKTPLQCVCRIKKQVHVSDSRIGQLEKPREVMKL